MAIQTFTSGQVLTAAQVNALQANDYNQTVATKTANYTLVAADKGTRVVMNVSSASTVTVNTSLFSAGDSLVIQNIATDPTVVTAGTATVSTAGSLSIPQFGSGTLYFTSASAAIFFPSAGPTASSGLTFISKTVLAASTQHNILNCFSTTYDHYVVKFTSLNLGGALNMRYGTSGTPDTGSNYSNNGFYLDVAQMNQSGDRFNQSSHSIANNTSTKMATFLDISSPFLTANTTYQAMNNALSGAVSITNFRIGVLNTTTSYTDLVLFSTADIEGTISIYGYAKV